MKEHEAHDLRAIGRQFQVRGDYIDAAPYGNGHINDTFAAVYSQGGTPVRYIHQRINHHVFKHPEALMDNVCRVTAHVAGKVADRHPSDASRRCLTLIPATDGRPFAHDAAGNTWRTYIFIEKARTYDTTETAQQACAAARAFGQFQRDLADLGGPRLHETIPDFHHTPARYRALTEAVDSDARNRAADAEAEIAFAAQREPIVNRLLQAHAEGLIPERITHNDTKLNNVMIDDQTSEGVCVIDLDTVMPGLGLYDFGDMVRSATNAAVEDERDLSRVTMRLPMFDALTRGYVASVGELLTPAERDHLAFSGLLITFEIGVRFLTDYLKGDVYFKTRRPGQNLDRCRVMFALAASMEAQSEAMETVVANALQTVPAAAG